MEKFDVQNIFVSKPAGGPMWSGGAPRHDTNAGKRGEVMRADAQSDYKDLTFKPDINEKSRNLDAHIMRGEQVGDASALLLCCYCVDQVARARRAHYKRRASNTWCLLVCC